MFEFEIEYNVRGMMEEDTILLEKDDVMLLYTDGLTEALDREGGMFSATLLSSFLLDKGTLEPIEIKASIITALEQFKCIDDVTIVIVKSK